MTFRENISKLVAGRITLRSMPEIALQALEQGMDSPSLRILAGLSDNENEFLIDRYFKDSLRELSIELPEKRQAAIEVGLAIANEIFDGKRTTFQGVRDIRSEALDAYPFFEESIQYCYDSIGFQRAYGLYVSIGDLRDAGTTQWQPDKTNKELEEELIRDLFVELKAWAERIKNGS